MLAKFAEQQVQSDAVAADDDQVGGLQASAEQLNWNGLAFVEHLGVLIDFDEAVGEGEGRHRAGALAHRPGLETRFASNETHQQVLRPASV